MHPQFTIFQVDRNAQQKPTLQMSVIKQGSSHQGIELAQHAKGVLQPSFIMGIIGNPGSGKSTLIQQFLLNNQFFGKRFQRVLFVGPTIYRKLVQDSFNTTKKLDLTWIYGQIQQANNWKCRSLLVIFDDVVSSMKNYSNPDFIDLFYNRRHLLKQGTISFIVTSQKWNLVPTFIRSAYNMTILYQLAPQQQQTLVSEINLSIPRKTFIHLMSSLKKHQFICVNHENGKMFDHQWKQF